MDPERLLRGIEMPNRAGGFPPHQCRCLILKPEYKMVVEIVDGGSDGPMLVARPSVEEPPMMREDRCAQLVHDGPDNPLCIECREHHWAQPGFRMWEPGP